LHSVLKEDIVCLTYTPTDGELKLLARCLKNIDALGVGQAHEILLEHAVQAVKQ